MNRYLLAGCAAAALAMGAGAANAQAKFELKLGGDAYFEGGYVDQDLDTGKRSTEFRNRFRLVVTPTAKADNGLEYGARARLRANNADGTLDADRGYIFVQGGFGQVRLGVTNSYNDDTYVSRPIDYQFLGIYDPFMAYIGGFTGAYSGTNTLTAHSVTVNANATKIVYYSPSFAGFQAGLSYTPRNDSFLTNVDRTETAGGFIAAGGNALGAIFDPTTGATTAAVGNWATTFQDVVEIGASYKNNLGGVDVAVGGGYFWGSTEHSARGNIRYKDLNAYQLGAKVTYAGFTFGGGYVNHGESGQNKAALYKKDNQVWNVGAQYATGPILVGVGYTHGVDAGNVNVAGERELDAWSFGGSYAVAPGLRVGAEYTYFDADAEGTAADDKGSVVLLRSVLAF